MDENIAAEEHWDDQVFINRQREISKLSRNFTEAVDKLLAEKPIVVEIPEMEEEEYEYVEEEEEDDDGYRDINGESLVLIHEIDVLVRDIQQIIDGIPPQLIKRNKYIGKIIQQLESLVNYMTTLRIRAEKLITA